MYIKYHDIICIFIMFCCYIRVGPPEHALPVEAFESYCGKDSSGTLIISINRFIKHCTVLLSFKHF